APARRPDTRRTPRPHRPTSARRQPPAAAGLPRLSGAHRSAPATRVAHGENHGTRGSRPRPVPETRRQSEPGGRPPSRRRNRSGLGDTPSAVHGASPRRPPPRVLRGERASRTSPVRRLAGSERNSEISGGLSASSAVV